MADINERDGMIFTAAWTPFETEQSAKMRAGVLKREGIKVKPMPYEDGFVLVADESDEDIDAMINDPNRPRYKFWEESSSLLIRDEDKDPRFEFRVVNEDANFWRNRVRILQKAGWSIVSGDIRMNTNPAAPERLGSVVAQPVGKGVKGILMRKPKKWFKEDRAEKDKINVRIMEQIKSRNAEDLGGAKVLKGETTIETVTG